MVWKDLQHFGWLQAIKDSASARGRPIKRFSPAKLRQALTRAGNILKPDEVNEVLLYLAKDGNIAELDQLYLVLTQDGNMHQLQCSRNVQQHPVEKQFFMWTDAQSTDMYDLLLDSKDQQVVDCEGWRHIAK